MPEAHYVAELGGSQNPGLLCHGSRTALRLSLYTAEINVVPVAQILALGLYILA